MEFVYVKDFIVNQVWLDLGFENLTLLLILGVVWWVLVLRRLLWNELLLCHTLRSVKWWVWMCDFFILELLLRWIGLCVLIGRLFLWCILRCMVFIRNSVDGWSCMLVYGILACSDGLGMKFYGCGGRFDMFSMLGFESCWGAFCDKEVSYRLLDMSSFQFMVENYELYVVWWKGGLNVVGGLVMAWN